ncbi:MAG TPA: nickel ABC transporter permease subunit NikC, partial [Helicobacter sp.]|nr:nickel ABC transporter permease subunit NikC [Helicobacter sp.]
GMAILLIVLAFNFWGDTLQTLLDPKHSFPKGHS